MAKARFESANIRRSWNDYILKLYEIDWTAADALKATTNIVKEVHEEIFPNMCEELEHTWGRMSNQLNLKFLAGVANMRSSFKCYSKNINHRVTQCRVGAGAQLSFFEI